MAFHAFYSQIKANETGSLLYKRTSETIDECLEGYSDYNGRYAEANIVMPIKGPETPEPPKDYFDAIYIGIVGPFVMRRQIGKNLFD